MHTSSYFLAPQLGGASPRETEALALGMCNDRLLKAETPRARIEALHKNHQLWSLLVRDLEQPGNRLPEALKRQLLALGMWAMTYSTRAMADGLSLRPLVEVNRNIIDGLRAPAAAAAAVAVTATANTAAPTSAWA